MKVKLIITPIDKNGGPANSDLRIRCHWQQTDTRKGSDTFGKKMWFWLTENGTVFNCGKTMNGSEGSLLTIGRGSVKEIELDDQDPEYENMVWFFKFGKHSQPRGEVNPNLVIPYIDVMVDADVLRLQYDSIMERYHVAGKLMDMDPDDLIDTAYSLGTSPENLTYTSLIATLIGPNFNGDAMIKKSKDHRGVEKLAVLAFSSAPKERKEIIAYVQKGIKHNIIKSENNTYTALDKNIGETIEKAVVYFQNNVEMYVNYLQRSVREWERDNFSISDFDDRAESMKPLREAAKVVEYRIEREEKKAEKKSVPVAEPPKEEEEDLDAELVDELGKQAIPEPQTKRPPAPPPAPPKRN